MSQWLSRWSAAAELQIAAPDRFFCGSQTAIARISVPADICYPSWSYPVRENATISNNFAGIAAVARALLACRMHFDQPAMERQLLV